MNRGVVKIGHALRVVGKAGMKVLHFVFMAVLNILDFICIVIEALFAPIFWDW